MIPSRDSLLNNTAGAPSTGGGIGGMAGLAGMAGLGPVGIGLGAIGTIADLFGQSKARKDAKKSAAEQRKLDVITSLISVAGGGGPRGVNAGAPAPGVDYGGALGGLGNLALTADSIGMKKSASAAQDKRLARLDKIEAEKAKVLNELRRAQTEKARRPASGNGPQRFSPTFTE